MHRAPIVVVAWLVFAVLGCGRAMPAQGEREVGHPGAAAPQASGNEQLGHPQQNPEQQQPEQQQQHEQSGGHGSHAEARPTMEMANDRFFKDQYEHSVPYVVWPADPEHSSVPRWLWLWNVNVMQWVAVLLLLLVFLPVLVSFQSNGRAGWLTRVFRGWVRWVRDEMVYSVMGKDEGRRYAPYFVFLFFFVAALNCLGLIPSFRPFLPVSTYTATGTPYVTGALALITFGMMLFFGMRQNGVLGYFKGLLPHGLPFWLVPLMLVVELIGQLVKPFALMIRLFANMLAGHLVIASLIGLIFLFAKMQGGAPTSYATAIPGAGMAIFIFIIEAFITLLQAYIFTYLSIIFVHQAVHQAH